MKRKSPLLRRSVHARDVRESLTRNQLETIGAIAIAYNEMEAALDQLLTLCLDYGGDSYEVTSRINGTEGKVAIIEASNIATSKLPAEWREVLANTLSGFKTFKTYRDGVVHARNPDVHTNIGRSRVRQGAHTEVLLSEPALEWLYQQISHVRYEFDALWTAFLSFHPATQKTNADRQQEEHRAQSLQAALAQCQGHQHHRQSLGPPAKFPDEEEIQRLQDQPLEVRLK
jgi:hypothetical protein